MVPLNKINDPEKVLPKKKDLNISSMQVLDTYRNDTIDQYNQVKIDGDVENLAFELFFCSISSCNIHEAKRLWIESMVDCKTYRERARYLLSNLDKFLVIRK